MDMLIKKLKFCEKNNYVFLCKNPKQILAIAGSFKINVVVMSYSQARSVVEFNKTVVFQDNKEYSETKYPAFTVYKGEIV